MPSKIVILNRKGGCGKTTLATNLAGYYASRGELAAVYDYDLQESAMRWLGRRPDDLAPIHGVAAAHPTAPGSTRAYQFRVPPETCCIIVDTPASLRPMELIDILRGASAILVPVLPSSIDLYVTEAFIQDLRKMARLHAPGAGIAAVANRVRRNTRSYQFLTGVLEELGLPPVASLRDTQYYISAAESGVSIHEMSGHLTRKDQEDWVPLVEWLAVQD